jgi:hypothetical protein
MAFRFRLTLDAGKNDALTRMLAGVNLEWAIEAKPTRMESAICMLQRCYY